MQDAFKFFDYQNHPFLNGSWAGASSSWSKAFDMPVARDWESLLNVFSRNMEAGLKVNSQAAEGLRLALSAHTDLWKSWVERSNEAFRDYPVRGDAGEQMAHGARHANDSAEEVLSRLGSTSRALSEISEKFSDILNERLAESLKEIRMAVEDGIQKASQAAEQASMDDGVVNGRANGRATAAKAATVEAKASPGRKSA